jgi:hypothetical protein
MDLHPFVLLSHGAMFMIELSHEARRGGEAAKERFRPADLVERVRRLVQTKPAVSNGMEAAS